MKRKNPYRRGAKKLDAIPAHLRYLLSGKRRGRMSQVRVECGCLFGTIAPPDVWRGSVEYPYANEVLWPGPFSEWAKRRFGKAAFEIVDELERLCDAYKPLTNTPEMCSARFAYVLDRVRAKADAWDKENPDD